MGAVAAVVVVLPVYVLFGAVLAAMETRGDSVIPLGNALTTR